MKRIAILGTVPISRRVTPYDDKSWEIWVCSPGNSQGGAPPRIDVWFELHALVGIRGPEHQQYIPAYLEWLRKQTFPIYMQEKCEEVPSAIVFPRDKLLKRFGPHKHGDVNWFTSSIAWMMALAIVQIEESGEKGEIGIFGVDMAATEEHYSWQKAGCQRFMEFAHDAGIKITVPLESTLASPTPLYGYDEASRMGRSMAARDAEMLGKIQQLDQQLSQIREQLVFFKGAREELQFFKRTFVSGLHDAELDIEVASDISAVEKSADELIAAKDAFAPLKPESALLVPRSVKKRDPKLAPSSSDFANAPGASLLAKPNGKYPPVIDVGPAMAEGAHGIAASPAEGKGAD